MATNKHKGVILVGGPKHGTRFRPLSLKCPKPLFPIGGVPMIYHHMQALAKIQGMSEILLIGLFPDSDMHDFVRHASRSLKVPVRYLREFVSLGTGGGIYHFRDQIMRGNPQSFFVMHADICADFPLDEMIAFHRGHGDRNTIMSVTARKDQAHSYGCLVADDNDIVHHYVEKPQTFVSTDINGGVYLFSAEIFEHMKAVFLKNHDDNGSGSDEIWLENDIIPELIAQGRLYMYKSTTFWSQIKTAGSAIYANRHYLSTYKNGGPDSVELAQNDDQHGIIKGDVVIDSTATVDPTAKLGPNVTVGPGVKVCAGARVRDTILLNNVQLLEHSCVLNSIVGWDSTIGQWSRVEGATVGVNPNDPTTHLPTKPLFNSEGRLEEGITIVGDGVDVASEIVVRNSIVMPHKDLTKSYSNEIIL